MFLAGLDRPVLQRTEGRWVVGVGAIVAVHVHHAVTLVGAECIEWAVDRDRLGVAAQTVTVGVGVREKTGLQDRVGGGLNTRNHVRGGESSLFDFGKVVLGVLVESEPAEAAQRHLGLRPDLGQVEDVPAELLGLLRAQGLHVAGPRGVLTPLDGLEQVLGVPVRVAGRELTSLLVREGLVALVSLAVDLDVVESAVGLDPLVGVARVTVHVAVGVGSATITEEMHDLMHGLLVGGEVVPEHGGILQVGLRVPLLSVDENGELGRIPNEEDGSVVEHPVPVTLLRVELHGKPTRVPCTIRRALFSTNRRETSEHLGFLANTLEHVDDCQITDVIRHLKLTIGASTLGMDNPFRDSLPVKVCQQVNQVKVLQQKRTILAHPLRGLWVHYRTAIGGGVDRSLIITVSTWR